MTVRTIYPNREFIVAELQAGDIIRVMDGGQPWSTGIVAKRTDKDITIERPYGSTSNFTYGGDGGEHVICYTGREVMTFALDSKHKFFVYQRMVEVEA